MAGSFPLPRFSTVRHGIVDNGHIQKISPRFRAFRLRRRGPTFFRARAPSPDPFPSIFFHFAHGRPTGRGALSRLADDLRRIVIADEPRTMLRSGRIFATANTSRFLLVRFCTT
jgi:hypothetical protein